MMQVSAYGRLGRDPEERQTRGGKAMVVSALAVAVNRFGEPEATEWLDLIAFGKAGEMLARHLKGETVSIAGTMTKRAYTGRDGAARVSWSVVVDSIVSARTARPGTGKKRNTGKDAAADAQAPLAGLTPHSDRPDGPDDAIPF